MRLIYLPSPAGVADFLSFRLLGFAMLLLKVSIDTDLSSINIHVFLTSDNILFNLPYDEERYKKTLEVGTYSFFLFIPITASCRFVP